MGDFIGGMGADPIPAWAGSVIDRKIAAEVGCAKKTVEKALASDSSPCYKPRDVKGTSFDPFEPQVRELLAETPHGSASGLDRLGFMVSQTRCQDPA